MTQEAKIYLEVARRARQHDYYELSADYYELYATETEEMSTTRLYTLSEISQAVVSIRRARSIDPANFKIPAIKFIREATGMGLKESRELVESIMNNM